MPVFPLETLTPRIDPEAWIAPGAVVIGDVTLLAGCTVWFNAVLRGDNEPMRFGANTNIQDGAVCHSDPGAPLSTGQGCTIGHNAIIHGCQLEDYVMIGMGATIMNNARIGAYTIVGANTLVPERKVVPSGVLALGSPVKIIRELTEAERLSLELSAKHYRLNGQRFKNEINTG